MPMKPLTLDTLRQCDPKIPEAFDALLRRATMDCFDRPADDKPRKVKLELALVPRLEPDGTCAEVEYQFFFAAAIPAHRTKVYSGSLRPNGTVLFNPDSPDNVAQATFMGDDEE
jgi:hypothetical protein